MNAIDLIAAYALITLASACFNGEKLEGLLLCADTLDTSEKRTGYQRKPNTHAGCTPDTPDTCQKVKMQVQNTKSGQEWA